MKLTLKDDDGMSIKGGRKQILKLLHGLYCLNSQIETIEQFKESLEAQEEAKDNFVCDCGACGQMFHVSQGDQKLVLESWLNLGFISADCPNQNEEFNKATILVDRHHYLIVIFPSDVAKTAEPLEPAVEDTDRYAPVPQDGVLAGIED